MSTTCTPASPDDFEPDAKLTEGIADPILVEHSAHKENSNAPRPALDATTLVPLGLIVAAGLVLWQNPDVRRACTSVLQDLEVHAVCRKAGDEIAASWRRHGGTTALASALFR